MICEFEQYDLNCENFPDFQFQLTLVPPCLPNTSRIRDEFDDRSIEVPHENGSLWIRVHTAKGDHAFAGHAVFGASFISTQCDTIQILQGFRRRGIATFLYDLTEEIFEVPVEPSSNLTGDARKFWQHRSNRKAKLEAYNTRI